MLGVVGIHTGAYSLSNPNVNIHLFALLEIFTRFSVPIFFFVSAFGLFLGQNLSEPFHYRQFMLRRCRGVLIPYVVWSLIYMLHYTYISNDIQIWSAPLIYEYFIFGLASYQLYFLVILLWFYSLMPLWRLLLKAIAPHPLSGLSLLCVLQIAFNYYSSYLLIPDSNNYFLQKALYHRLSYWVFHYLLIFITGGLCALYFKSFQGWIKNNHLKIKHFFFSTLAGMMIFYYYLIYSLGYTPEQAVNTDHQLSPVGVLYTMAASIFWFTLLENIRSDKGSRILSLLGKHSYLVYLVHPLAMYYIWALFTQYQIEMTVPFVILFYTSTVAASLGFSITIEYVSRLFPIFNLLLQGKGLVKANSRI